MILGNEEIIFMYIIIEKKINKAANISKITNITQLL